jgi:hypothetical protein
VAKLGFQYKVKSGLRAGEYPYQEKWCLAQYHPVTAIAAAAAEGSRVC